MEGVAVIRQVLAANAALIALVPATRIQAGDMPQGTTLPAISIVRVSSNDRNLPNPGTYRHVTERVQVNVMASTYPQQRTVLAAIRAAAADQFPTVSGLIRVTIHTDGAGPDFINEQASIFVGSQDFMVTYSEQRA